MRVPIQGHDKPMRVRSRDPSSVETAPRTHGLSALLFTTFRDDVEKETSWSGQKAMPADQQALS